jgi:hypothetical protein
MSAGRYVERAIRRTAVWQSLRHLRRRIELWKWERSDRRQPPPPLVKQRIVRAYGEAFALRTLVETGTYRGDMVNACRHSFDRITTIELDDVLHAEARRRFRRYAHITPIHGDSGKLIGDVLQTATSPVLFWLDGHYCGEITAKGPADTPITAELRVILSHPVSGHVVLIDDAHCFTGMNDYPTLEQLSQLVRALRPEWVLTVRNDIIRLHAPLPSHRPSLAD